MISSVRCRTSKRLQFPFDLSWKLGTWRTLRIHSRCFQLVDTFVRSFWWERRGDREWIARRNFDKKIRRDLRFLSRAVTRRNTGVEMDRCVHSKCHRNAGITLTEVSRPFVPPPSPVYLRSRERRTHATQQLFYIRQDSSTCGKQDAKSLLGKSHVATK